ncbi:HTH domain-containing protein [Streptomyces sp. NPDC096013]|uniref:HTH domain-containing protein n=1 Tax=Streptomyces sp. NPDC096013 TaxID=3366069 RepID=UPI0037FA4EEA
MTPADARALRRRKVAELREAEPDLSLRQMAERLGLSRDTVTRDLDEIGRRAAEDAPPAEAVAEPVPHSAPVADGSPAEGEDGGEAVDDSAPQASTGVAEVAPPAEPPVAPVAEVVAEGGRERRPLAVPRRLVDTQLTIDLAGWPELRRDLAVLAATGKSPEALISQAVVVLAHGYRQGVRTGAIRPDRPFVAGNLDVRPPRVRRPRRPVPPAEGSPGA